MAGRPQYGRQSSSDSGYSSPHACAKSSYDTKNAKKYNGINELRGNCDGQTNTSSTQTECEVRDIKGHDNSNGTDNHIQYCTEDAQQGLNIRHEEYRPVTLQSRGVIEAYKGVGIVTGIHKPPAVYSKNNTLRAPQNFRNTTLSTDFSANTIQLYPKNNKPSTKYLSHTTEITKAIECFHAQDYNTMIVILKSNQSNDFEVFLLCTFGCGLAYYKLSKLSSATELFNEYMKLAQTHHRTADISLAHVYLGDIRSMDNDYIRAANHYLEAVRNHGTDNVCETFKLAMPTLSALYAKQGAALRQASQVAKAIDAFRNAVKSAECGKDKLSSHNSLGNLLQSLGDHAGALEEYKVCVGLGEELKDYVSLGWTHGNIGNAYLGIHEKDKALFYLKSSLDLVLKHEPTPAAICRAYNNLGTAYQALNELNLAEENYKLAQTQAVYGSDKTGEGRALGNLGNLYLLCKDYPKAVECYSEVLQLSKDRSVETTVYHNRGCAYYEWAEMKKCSSSADLTPSVQQLYNLAAGDLNETIKRHEEIYLSAKGSSRGLNLSVSLTESNSRSYHRLQDCLVNLDKPEDALVVAEKSRARSLGEVLLEKKRCKEHNLTYPLTLDAIKQIAASQKYPTVYLSYTGARLLLWLLIPINNDCKIYHKLVQVDKLEQDKFEGKPFDHYVCYSVSRAAGDINIELFGDSNNSPVSHMTTLYEIVAVPILDMLEAAHMQAAKQLIIIPDSYTCLIPFAALHRTNDYEKTFGDMFCIQIMPSLLVLGILGPQMHQHVSIVNNYACVVGNPDIPMFEHNGEEWNLGRLPHAATEAEWISYILKTSPLLDQQATKKAVVNHMMSANIIHIATHGSAVSGFLAFAGVNASFRGAQSDAKDVLLFPSEVEQLSIHPALVVLSSCDSARGTVRADGIMGMGRAFLCSGALSILTTLWKVPDESAGVLMQFFYQNLVDGSGTTTAQALQKAIRSLRCIRKYSHYAHWGAYQLCGKEMVITCTKTETEHELEARLGPKVAFPRHDIMKQLESSLLYSNSTPSNVQILWGCPGTKPSEPAVNFIYTFYEHFKDGIYWIDASSSEGIEASCQTIVKVVENSLQHHRTLVVLDDIESMQPIRDSLSGSMLLGLLKNPGTCVVAITQCCNHPLKLQQDIDHYLSRGACIHEISSLPQILAMQRLVYALEKHQIQVAQKDLFELEECVHHTCGSPDLLNLTASVLVDTCGGQSNPQEGSDQQLQFKNLSSFKPLSPGEDSPCSSENVVTKLLECCSLSTAELLVLYCLSGLSAAPIPILVIKNLINILGDCGNLMTPESVLRKLEMYKFVYHYPQPVIMHTILMEKTKMEDSLYYVPPTLSAALWSQKMGDEDKMVALTLMYKALNQSYINCSHTVDKAGILRILALVRGLHQIFGTYVELMGEECYTEVCSLAFQAKTLFNNHYPRPEV